eukprot:424801-Amphidinium_carterae.1
MGTRKDWKSTNVCKVLLDRRLFKLCLPCACGSWDEGLCHAETEVFATPIRRYSPNNDYYDFDANALVSPAPRSASQTDPVWLPAGQQNWNAE